MTFCTRVLRGTKQIQRTIHLKKYSPKRIKNIYGSESFSKSFAFGTRRKVASFILNFNFIRILLRRSLDIRSVNFNWDTLTTSSFSFNWDLLKISSLTFDKDLVKTSSLSFYWNTQQTNTLSFHQDLFKTSTFTFDWGLLHAWSLIFNKDWPTF